MKNNDEGNSVDDVNYMKLITNMSYSFSSLLPVVHSSVSTTQVPTADLKLQLDHGSQMNRLWQ